MANETSKTVTISADYFAELYEAKKDKDQYSEAVLNIAKERDELKAKLNKYLERTWCGECDDETKARLAAAERCIEDIEKLIDCDEADNTVGKIIRAWREKREAK